MENMYTRTAMLIGMDNIEKLKKAHVAVFGIGGVGGYVVEALVRSGVGKLTLIDSDKVAVSNLNRQIIATTDTAGQYKTEAAKARALSINPECEIVTHNIFFLPETAHLFDFSEYDYVIDAVDTVSAKIEIITRAKAANIPVISSMGTGNKLHPEKLELADIYDTSVCPLARVMRNELKKRGVTTLKVVYSKETPIKPNIANLNSTETPVTGRRSVPGSIAFVPGAAGLIIAGETVRELINA
jgi:tRNA A37 threonylcarbamoyladenosine dehydratase